MILYYYPQLELLAMWYYKMVKGKKELWLWVHKFNYTTTIDTKAAHPNLNSVRYTVIPPNWREVIEDSGDE